jgi:hypothetical protein
MIIMQFYEGIRHLAKVYTPQAHQQALKQQAILQQYCQRSANWLVKCQAVYKRHRDPKVLVLLRCHPREHCVRIRCKARKSVQYGFAPCCIL